MGGEGARPYQGAYFGEALPDEPAIHALEARLQVRCTVVSFYWSWGLGRSAEPIDVARAVARAGRIPLLTWEPWRLPAPGEDPARDPAFALSRIIAGEHDAYVDWFAGQLASVPGPVWLRPMHEMNGNWYPWCGTTNGNRPEELGPAWRHLRRLFARRGAFNVRWMWSPYALSVPTTPENAIGRYYPGDGHVDLLGLDGYNWGTSRPWSRWQTFDELFRSAYRLLRTLSPRPIVIAEVGCADAGGDKARWLRDARAAVARDYSSIRGVVWFNVDKECDWRVDSSPESLAAFRSTWGHDREGAMREVAPSGR